MLVLFCFCLLAISQVALRFSWQTLCAKDVRSVGTLYVGINVWAPPTRRAHLRSPHFTIAYVTGGVTEQLQAALREYLEVRFPGPASSLSAYTYVLVYNAGEPAPNGSTMGGLVALYLL